MRVNTSRRLEWETFLVRLWRESVIGAWRGQIVHLASRESSYFASLEQAEAFISRFAQGIVPQTGALNETVQLNKEEQNVSPDVSNDS